MFSKDKLVRHKESGLGQIQEYQSEKNEKGTLYVHFATHNLLVKESELTETDIEVDICYKYKVSCEVSLERYMKCGFGICGQCCVDPEGICVCQDGPVFSGSRVRKIKEFGNYYRDKAGVRHKFH